MEGQEGVRKRICAILAETLETMSAIGGVTEELHSEESNQFRTENSLKRV